MRFVNIIKIISLWEAVHHGIFKLGRISNDKECRQRRQLERSSLNNQKATGELYLWRPIGLIRVEVDGQIKHYQKNLSEQEILNYLCRQFKFLNNLQMDFSKHSEGTTSVKVHNAPGGKSSFSLAWDAPEPAPKKNNNPQPVPQAPTQPQQTAGHAQKKEVQPAGKTSVKVHNPPGGKSNFTLG